MSEYSKAIAAIATGVIGILAQVGLDVSWATPGVIAGFTTLASAIAVWWFKNQAK